MKSSWSGHLLATLLLCAAAGLIHISAAVAAPNQTAAPSLIANGSFETDANADGVPDGWPKPSSEIQWQSEKGNRFLRLHSTTPGKMVLVYRAITIPAGVKGLQLRFRVRYDGIQAGAHSWYDGRIMMNFKGADGKKVKPSPPAPSFHGSSDGWVKRSVKFLVPEGTTKLEFMPALFRVKAGTADFDDMTLTPMTASDVTAMVAANAAKAAKHDAAQAKREAHVDEKLAAQLKATGDLIVNGGFETPNKAGDWPDGWGHKPKKSSDLSWRSEQGDHYLRIVSPKAGKLTMLYRMILLPRDAKGLEISVRYRTSGIKKGKQMPGDARVIFHFIGGNRTGRLESGPKVHPDPHAMIFSSKAAAWTTKAEQCLVPEGATKLQVMAGLWFVKAGTVDLTDIHIKPMSNGDAAQLAAAIDATAKQKSDRAAYIDKLLAQPAVTPEIKVSGNRLVTVADGKPVWLQGLSVDSMQWSMGEHILWSIHVAIDQWHANVIRLPVQSTFWFGHGKSQRPGTEDAYRHLVDQAVKLCAAKGAYLALDLHHFGAPMAEDVAFWKDAAARYKNNPAVLFELFNEPHGISWQIWRNGGNLKSAKNKSNDVNPTENTKKQKGKVSVGMQALVDAVRNAGARNVLLAGGVDWSYDLRGVVNGYALDDRGGDGIVYVTHIYPWKRNWADKVLVAAKKYPLIVTEVGCPSSYKGFQFIPPKQRYPLDGWAEDVIGMIQKYKLNVTYFSFHPYCGPEVISDWNYTPTPYWGVYVKEALAGKTFDMKKMR